MGVPAGAAAGANAGVHAAVPSAVHAVVRTKVRREVPHVGRAAPRSMLKASPAHLADDLQSPPPALPCCGLARIQELPPNK